MCTCLMANGDVSTIKEAFSSQSNIFYKMSQLIFVRVMLPRSNKELWIILFCTFFPNKYCDTLLHIYDLTIKHIRMPIQPALFACICGKISKVSYSMPVIGAQFNAIHSH